MKKSLTWIKMSIGFFLLFFSMVFGIVFGFFLFPSLILTRFSPLGSKKTMRMFSEEGHVLLEIRRVERRDKDIVLKGKLLGTIPSTIHIKPEEAGIGLEMIDGILARYIPIFIFKILASRIAMYKKASELK